MKLWLRLRASRRLCVVQSERVFLLSKPSPAQIRAFLRSQEGQRFLYADVGASRERAPRGYVLDHNRIQLGQGPRVFDRAAKGIRQWRMFDMAWLHLCWSDTPPALGVTVAVLVSHFGFWSLNACRVVYVIEEHGATETYGFAYGTLAEHAEVGEERFTVEFHHDDRTVWYDIYVFSRPNPLTCLAYPVARALQKRFVRDSKDAMRKAVQHAAATD